MGVQPRKITLDYLIYQFFFILLKASKKNTRQRIQETIPTYIATDGINIPIIDKKSEITVRTFCQSKISFSLKAMHKAIKSDTKTTQTKKDKYGHNEKYPIINEFRHSKN